MIPLLINSVKMLILLKILYSMFNLLVFKKKNGKSVSGKIWQLVFNRLHYFLDARLRAQRDKRAIEIEQPSKITPMKKYKTAKAK